MIQNYIRAIQSIFLKIIKYYKTNVSTSYHNDGRELTPEVMANLQKSFAHQFSDDLKTLLNWCGIMPIWRAPFLPFDKGGKNYQVWANRGPNIEIRLRKRPGEKLSRLEIMHGDFELKEQKMIFKVFVDVDGEYSPQQESVVAKYGPVKQGYSDSYAEGIIPTLVVLADSVAEFARKYLKYLKTLPIKPKKMPKSLYNRLNEPMKLFKYVSHYNWDDGEEIMEMIIDDPRCDEATALLIYWLSEPYFYDDDSFRELKLIGNVIEENFKKGFYAQSTNRFDPSDNKIANFIREYNEAESKGRTVPKHMLDKRVD